MAERKLRLATSNGVKEASLMSNEVTAGHYTLDDVTSLKDVTSHSIAISEVFTRRRPIPNQTYRDANLWKHLAGPRPGQYRSFGRLQFASDFRCAATA